MLDWDEQKKLLKKTGADIEALSAAVFYEFMRRLKLAGFENPRDILSSLISEFDTDYQIKLSAALSESLRKSISADDVAQMKIGGVRLSKKLYKNRAEVERRAVKLINNHLKGWVDARKLAMDLYDGYTDKEEILKWNPRNKKLPLHLRQAVLRDHKSRTMLLSVIKKNIDGMKTPALRVAYYQALQAVQDNAGVAAIEKKLSVAVREKMRFNANRIAQTEIQRAWMMGQAREIMEDEDVKVVRFALSSSHPTPDICDVFAKQDAYGLGAGLYPKGKAPIPPLHPFCRCRLESKYKLKDNGATKNKNAQKELMASIAKQDKELAAKIAGSKRKLDAMLKGESLESLYNENKPKEYHIGRELSSLDFQSHSHELVDF